MATTALTVLDALSADCSCGHDVFDRPGGGHRRSHHYKPAQVAIMLAVAASLKAPNTAEVGNMVGMAPSTVASHVRRLVQSGWLIRTGNGNIWVSATLGRAAR